MKCTKTLLLVCTAIAIWAGNSAAISNIPPNPNPDFKQSERETTQTLFSSEVRHGGFGSLIYGVSTLNGQAVYLRGTRGAWIINLSPQHTLHLGLAGYRTRPDVDPAAWVNTDIQEPEMRTDYGGFEVEYVNRSYKLIHMGAQMLIGSGEIRYEDRDPELENTRDSYFVMQPGINTFLNLTSWFRISGGVYYRYAANVNLQGTGDVDVSGLAGILGLRFGKF